MTEPVNELHRVLRIMALPDAIEHLRLEITIRGHAVVKSDPGVFAWVGENRVELSKIARLGGLNGQA